eukprot:jgi/Chlat1/6665/Chrsp49S06158
MRSQYAVVDSDDEPLHTSTAHVQQFDVEATSTVPSSSSTGGWFRRLFSTSATPNRAGYDAVCADASEEPPDVAEKCPEEAASLWSTLIFAWVSPLLKVGHQKPLEQTDLWSTARRDLPPPVAQRLMHTWSLQKTKDRPSVVLALFQAYGKLMAAAALPKIVYDMLQYAQPLVLRALLDYIGSIRSRPLSHGFGLVFFMLAIQSLNTLLLQAYFHRVYRVSLHVRTGLIAMVYQKALRISNTAKDRIGTGTIVNLMSNDAEKLCSVCIHFHTVWSSPLQITMAIGLLFYIVGILPALAGLAVMLLLLPANGLLARWSTSVRKRLIDATDNRVRLLSEVIHGIKAIKLYAWEQPFQQRISQLRDKELKEVRTTVFLEAFDMMFYSLSPVLVAVATFTVFTMQGNPLTAAVAFPALALFNLLRFPMSILPYQINQFIQAYVALKRVQDFVSTGELPPRVDKTNVPSGTVVVDNGTFTWDEDTPTLQNINLNLQPGTLAIVVGEVASGKSTLLAALLGEIKQLSGSLACAGSIAYTAQDTWIQNATLRENILMGRAVIQACALKHDIAMLPAGDASEIGEKGINLSGGQKHRVALARAAYSNADVFLLDDPLSAVDTHVGKQLMDECICGIMNGRTRVLVTHQLQYLDRADIIMVVKAGRITDIGTHAELQARGVNFVEFSLGDSDGSGDGSTDSAQSIGRLGEHGADASVEAVAMNGNSVNHDADVGEQKPDFLSDAGQLIRHDSPGDGGVEEVAVPLNSFADAAQEGVLPVDGLTKAGEDKYELVPLHTHGSANNEARRSATESDDKHGDGTLTKDENRAFGQIDYKVYRDYLRAWGNGSFGFFAMVLVAYSLSQTSKVSSDTWLAIWSKASTGKGSEQASHYLVVYTCLALSVVVFLVLRAILASFGTVAASRSLHGLLLARTLHLPMSFFDSQPTGRLINRFTRDIEQIDVTLPDTFESYLGTLFNVLFSVATICVVTPPFLLPFVPIAFIYNSVQRYYIRSSRELKRLDSIARSPVFAHFSETLYGLSTVRAYAQAAQFIDINYNRVQESNRAYFASVTLNRWLGIRLETMGACIVFSVGFFAVLSGRDHSGLAGLALTSALVVTTSMSWLVRVSADLESQMNSVERVLEYCELQPEPPAIVEDNRPPTNWPAHGAIQVKELCVRYRPELPPVLMDVSFNIKGGEKIGICGRTGCGKSTLMMALYRIVEPYSGTVYIDGIDTSLLGLQDLRSRLALVPQDPVIFSGSVRSNIDPFGEAQTDAQLWDALQQAGLAASVSALPGGLDASISESGSNMSTGQRQLLCMARALLRRTKVLILDEATSNVDSVTDGVIQSTIRSAFASCTVLTIAHRLHTVIDSDRILVLDKGRKVEMDHPAALLTRSNSAFASLVDDAMPNEAASLRRSASAAAMRSSSLRAR